MPLWAFLARSKPIDFAKEKEMRQVTLAVAALAAFSFAMLSTAQADSNWGPLKKGDKCWIHRGVSTMDSLGYWGACGRSEEGEGSASARAQRAKAKASGKSKTANTTAQRPRQGREEETYQ